MEKILFALILTSLGLTWLVLKYLKSIVTAQESTQDGTSSKKDELDIYFEDEQGNIASPYIDGSSVVTIPIPSNFGENLALVFASTKELEIIRREGQEIIHTVPSQLSKMVAGTDALVKNGLNMAEAQGVLVRLTKESSNALKSMQTMKDGSGAIMGVLQESNGKFGHIIRFNPASKLAALSSFTGVLNALALQAQLASIEKAIAQVGEVAKRIERVQWNIIESEMRAIYSILNETYEAASSCNELTDVLWDQIQSCGVAVRKYDYFTSQQLTDIIVEIQNLKSVTQKKAWFTKEYVRLRENVLAAELSLQISLKYDYLRLWRLLVKRDPSLDHYVGSLESVVMHREITLANLKDEMGKAIEDASRKTQYRKFGIFKLNSNSLVKLMHDIQIDFEALTNRAWADQSKITPMQLEE